MLGFRPTCRQVNAMGLLREVHAAEERLEVDGPLLLLVLLVPFAGQTLRLSNILVGHPVC